MKKIHELIHTPEIKSYPLRSRFSAAAMVTRRSIDLLLEKNLQFTAYFVQSIKNDCFIFYNHCHKNNAKI